MKIESKDCLEEGARTKVVRNKDYERKAKEMGRMWGSDFVMSSVPVSTLATAISKKRRARNSKLPITIRLRNNFIHFPTIFSTITTADHGSNLIPKSKPFVYNMKDRPTVRILCNGKTFRLKRPIFLHNEGTNPTRGLGICLMKEGSTRSRLSIRVDPFRSF